MVKFLVPFFQEKCTFWPKKGNCLYRYIYNTIIYYYILYITYILIHTYTTIYIYIILHNNSNYRDDSDNKICKLLARYNSANMVRITNNITNVIESNVNKSKTIAGS